ncbi:hypothetical protein PFUGPA_02670 [Plasmodium falciparum Palo Alto/Uganda]|uniref:Uncharacterized protein n=3 Tax=Plasmodium falciparum TaxID=5833 RepID=W7K3A3_PLAFO|nr:hypothetical protein PFMALIP_05980 [Plasmodium falciparum MaliPS096_E11]ETW55338.1 hypothetical protein PFUGPA_02670 [Plasmodium falciparum Palo Alto/Uganda]EWC87275.1 hypothetical protein PFNF54_04052 [Plasmodium falciparum NF54]
MRAIIIYIRFTPITTIVLHICMLYTTHKKKQVVTTVLLKLKFKIIKNYFTLRIFYEQKNKYTKLNYNLNHKIIEVSE